MRKSEFDPGIDFSKLAWTRLITRFDSYLKRSVRDEGIIVSDECNEKSLRLLIRKMRIYNPTPSHYSDKVYNAMVSRVIEDIVHRKSFTSYFIQTVDVIAFLLYKKEFPRGSTKKFNLDKLFDLIAPITLREASRKDPLGIVRN